MDILKAEIERKKKQLEAAKVLSENKTYFSRGELVEKEAEEYWRKHKRLKESEEIENTANSSVGRNNSSENLHGSIKSSHSGVSLISEGSSEALTGGKKLPKKEIIGRLRHRHEPIRLFGESDDDVWDRLKRLEISEPEAINKGFKNDLKMSMDRVDQDYLREIVGDTTDDDSSEEGRKRKLRKVGNVDVKDDPTITWDYVVGEGRESLRKGDLKKDQRITLDYLKLVLSTWGKDLNSRESDEKLSITGKLLSATYTQTVSYINPLMRKLKNGTLMEDQADCLAEIIVNLLDRDYLKANEAYLEMAIGNAPWPIGVTMVGIHARPGREKVSSRYVAHVLNDETQRKYIQALKRLMHQAQRLFPNDDPCRCVNFESLVDRDGNINDKKSSKDESTVKQDETRMKSNESDKIDVNDVTSENERILNKMSESKFIKAEES